MNCSDKPPHFRLMFNLVLRFVTICLSGCAVMLTPVPLYANAGNTDNSQAGYEQIHRLDCDGSFLQYRAEVSGVRIFVPTNALGDGRVSFNGSLIIGIWEFVLLYEDWSSLRPYEGALIVNESLWYQVAVLDNQPGDKMIIYDGTPTLGPPDTLGEFICNWDDNFQVP